MAWRRLGEQVRALREERGLTREQLAEATGLSAVYLKKLEAGERSSPSFPVLERIARALGCTLNVSLRSKGGRHGR
jgi:XRE family transcriptional regulator of biofilm formation